MTANPLVRLLVVEDEAIFGHDLASVLENFHYKVLDVIPTGEEAIRVAGETQPDLVLMDIILAGRMTGIDAAVELRAKYGIPVVFLTANADNGTIQLAKRAQPLGYLLKPIRETDLFITVEMALSRAHMERSLATSEQRFTVTFRAVRDGVILTDQSGAIISVNPAAEQMVGKLQTALLGCNVSEAIELRQYGTGEVHAPEIEAACPTGGHVEQSWLVQPDGSRRPVEHFVDPILSEAGQLQAAVLILRDLTQRLADQVRIHRKNKALEVTLDVLTSFLEKRDLRASLDRCISSVAQHCEVAVLHYADGKLAFVTSPIECPLHVPGLDQALAATLPIRLEEWCYTPLADRQKDVPILVYRARNAPPDNLNDAGIELLLVTRTAALLCEADRRSRREAELEDQLRVSQKLEALGSLAGGVAHDFNNLLAAIMGHISLLLEEEMSEEFRSTLEDVQNAGQRAARLTNKLLSFSRRQMLQPHPLDPNAAVRELERLVKPLLGASVTLDLRLESKNPILIDHAQFEQVLLNLAINARDAMPCGGTLTIGTCDVLAEDKPVVQIEVGDSGTGMDAATVARIFEPFYSTKGTSGLGLATVYGIVQQSGGSIHVASEVGNGTVFTLCFPSVNQVHARSVEATSTYRPAWRPGRALVVEDEPSVLSFVCEVLRRSGWIVDGAGTPQQAREMVESAGCKFQLLISDLLLPATSGRELASELMPWCEAPRVLFISGYTDDQGFREMVRAGAQGVNFLAKPFTSESLLAAIDLAMSGEEFTPE